MSEVSERWRIAFQAGQVPAAGPACPPAEELWDFVRGELATQRSEPLVKHSADCSTCTAALRIALEMSEAARPPVVARPRQWRVPAVLGLGAAAVAAAAVLALLPTRPAPGEIRERGGAPAEIRSLLPQAPQARSGLALEWAPVPGAVRYQVTLATPRLQVLFQKSGVRTPRVEIPEAVLAGQPAGTHLVWRVEAVIADGQTAESPAFDLVLR